MRAPRHSADGASVRLPVEPLSGRAQQRASDAVNFPDCYRGDHLVYL